jgi:very-short-patch-repair endonuclease
MRYSVDQLDEQEYIQVAKNCYATRGEWRGYKYEEKHIALCGLVVTKRQPFVFTAQSACAIWGIGRIGDCDMRLHAISQNRKSVDPLIQWHFGPSEMRTKTIHGLRVASPIRAICDLAGHETPESILTSINSCLYKKLFTKYELGVALKKLAGKKWSNYLERLALFATDKSESPFESQAWIEIYKSQLVMPEQQREIEIAGREKPYRIDMYWEFKGRRLILEIDGREKYKTQDVLYSEKQREDELRALGYKFIRLPYWKLKKGMLPQILKDAGVPKRRYFGKLFPDQNRKG